MSESQLKKGLPTITAKASMPRRSPAPPALLKPYAHQIGTAPQPPEAENILNEKKNQAARTQNGPEDSTIRMPWASPMVRAVPRCPGPMG